MDEIEPLYQFQLAHESVENEFDNYRAVCNHKTHRYIFQFYSSVINDWCDLYDEEELDFLFLKIITNSYQRLQDKQLRFSKEKEEIKKMVGKLNTRINQGAWW